MSDTSLVFNLVARDNTEQGLSSARERFDQVATGIGAGAGLALGASLVQGISIEGAQSKLAAQLGLTEAESGRVGKVAGDLYAHAYGDSIETVNAAVGSVMSSIRGMSSASSADLESVTQKALNFASTFDIEVDRAVQSVGTLINSGLATNATQAFDLITAASQRVPAQLREDVLDASDEYSQFFRTLGYSGEEAFAVLVDGSKKGAFGIDKAGDAVKEFTILSTDMSASSQAAYKAIGLDARDMANKILAGGSSAQGATQKIINGLLGIKDPSAQASAAIGLFGTPLEDMNVADIPEFLRGLKGASGSMDDFGGSAKKSGDTLRNNGATALEEFKRKLMSVGTEGGGALARFAMDNKAVVEPLAYTLLGLAATVLVVKAGMIAYSAVSTVVTTAHAIMSASTWGVIGAWLRMNAIGIGVYLRLGVAATAAGIRTAAAWAGSALVSIGAWILAVLRAGATAAVQFTLMAARAVIWAATMAAQWLIAMGPIGWIIAAVIALVAIVVANWDTIKKATLAAWSWVVGRLVWARDFMVKAFLNWTLIGLFIKHWTTIKTVTVTKALALVAWVRGLPGRISNGIGSLGNLLTAKGRAVVQGLWSGISSMGGWIKSKLLSWAKSMVPGPIAKALGIASPSKVTKAQGRWVARGLIEGLTGSGKQVKAASTKLADIVRDAMAPGRKRSKALTAVSTGTSSLLKLARQEESLAGRLKTASTKLADLIKERDKLAADVSKGILDAANITQGTDGATTARSILDALQGKLQAAMQFATDLAALRKKGIRSDLIAQVAQAGVEGGAAAAAALANADRSTIAQINTAQARLTTAATATGKVAGDAMYGAGIDAANGLIKGLKAKEKAIEQQMLRIAKGMSTAVKKALGIRSPSKLFADEVGAYIPPGVVAGMERTAPQLDTALRALVQPELAAPQRPVSGTGMAPLAGSRAGGILGRVVVDVRGSDEDLKRLFRKMVRVDGGGSVQTAFGRGA